MPGFLRLSVLLCGVFSSVNALATDLPTASEVVAGYRQNLQAFDGLYVRWRYERRRTELYRQALINSASDLDLQASSKIDGDEQKEALKKSAESTRKVAKDFDPARVEAGTISAFSFDGQVQIRIPRNHQSATDGAELDRGSLTGAYSSTLIWSRPSASSPWLFWSGSVNNPSGGFETRLADTLIGFLPPGLPVDLVPLGHLHSFDRFFASSPESLVVVGFTEFKKTAALIVENVERTPAEAFLPPERLEELRHRLRQEIVTRAWIDPAAGYWPRRIERFARWFLDDRELSHPMPPKGGFKPSIEDVTIEKIPNGGFFPTHGVIRQWQSAAPVSKIWILDIVDGRSPIEIELAPIVEDEWWAEAVTARARTEFQLDKLWPRDAQVLDVASGQVLVQDAAGELVRAKAEQLIRKSSSTGFRPIWLVIGGTALAIGISVWLWRRRLR